MEETVTKNNWSYYCKRDSHQDTGLYTFANLKYLRLDHHHNKKSIKCNDTKSKMFLTESSLCSYSTSEIKVILIHILSSASHTFPGNYMFASHCNQECDHIYVDQCSCVADDIRLQLKLGKQTISPACKLSGVAKMNTWLQFFRGNISHYIHQLYNCNSVTNWDRSGLLETNKSLSNYVE